MPKILPPESGHNVKDELDKIRSNSSSFLSFMTKKICAPYEEEGMDISADFNTVEQSAGELMRRINRDTCCDASQYSEILEDLFRLAKMRSNVISATHEASQSNNGQPDYSRARELWREYKTALSVLSRDINQFRLACLNCLSDDCKKRNPKSPADGVRQRAKRIIMP